VRTASRIACSSSVVNDPNTTQALSICARWSFPE
jgi:hypothetical protein